MIIKLGLLINEWKISYDSGKVIVGGDYKIAPDSWLDRTPRRGQQPEYIDILVV